MARAERRGSNAISVLHRVHQGSRKTVSFTPWQDTAPGFRQDFSFGTRSIPEWIEAATGERTPIPTEVRGLSNNLSGRRETVDYSGSQSRKRERDLPKKRLDLLQPPVCTRIDADADALPWYHQFDAPVSSLKLRSTDRRHDLGSRPQVCIRPACCGNPALRELPAGRLELPRGANPGRF